jgi:hypothetical protein
MSPRAKTLARLQVLAAAAAVAACGKKDADRGYGVVDPMPIPTAIMDAEPPKISPARHYADHVSARVTKRAGENGSTRYRFVVTPKPDLRLDHAEPLAAPLELGKPDTGSSSPDEMLFEIVAPRSDAGLPPIGMHLKMRGAAGMVDVWVEWKDGQTIVNVSDATPK